MTCFVIIARWYLRYSALQTYHPAALSIYEAHHMYTTYLTCAMGLGQYTILIQLVYKCIMIVGIGCYTIHTEPVNISFAMSLIFFKE